MINRRMRALTLVCLLALSFATAHAQHVGLVTASALVLRDAPGLDAAMLGEIPQGAELQLGNYTDGWFAVNYNGQSGYVSAMYVEVITQGAVAPVQQSTPNAPLPAETAPPAMAQSAFSLPPIVFTGVNNPAYPAVMQPGDMGNSVIDLQTTLQAFGHQVNADGQYGYDTQAAVMKIQLALGLSPDGVVGAETRRMIGIAGEVGRVEKLDWWLGGNVAIARFAEATVQDVRTGKRFRIRRYGGDNHLDAEPMTETDTRTMLEIAGGTWTWDRRPIWLETGGRVIAASMHSMPHQGQHITGNGFEGHFCIHFLHSRTHDTDRIDEEHAACVEEAWAQREAYRAQ